jgi:hypothetical protein
VLWRAGRGQGRKCTCDAALVLLKECPEVRKEFFPSRIDAFYPICEPTVIAED